MQLYILFNFQCIWGHINLVSYFLDLLTIFFSEICKKIKPQARDHYACLKLINTRCLAVYWQRQSKSLVWQAAKKRSFSRFTVGEGYHSLILPRLSILEESCMSWSSKHGSMANFNDIHNLLIRFILFCLHTYRPYLRLPSVQETWN